MVRKRDARPLRLEYGGALYHVISRGNRYQYDAEGQLTDAWYDAVDPAGSYSWCLRQGHFDYDALGNRRRWNYVQNKGWMHFLRQDNGLNQYLSWENNYPWNDPQHWGTTTNYDKQY